MELQPASYDIWDQKHRLKSIDGEIIDKTPEDTIKRVANALANNAEEAADFQWAITNGALPGGRIVANAGAEEHKPATSLINCTVSGNIHDSIEGIFHAVAEGANTLKTGAGIGYCFTSLRPKGGEVRGAGASTSGVMSFMNVFDTMCTTIASAGGRRGAQLGSMHIFHPDIEAFITAKQQAGILRQFNLSVMVTDEFMRAVDQDRDWELYFPTMHVDSNTVYRTWPFEDPEYTKDYFGGTACKIYKVVKARDLWDLIMRSTYDYAEPGIMFSDRINYENNLWFREYISATNPCKLCTL